MKTSNIYAKVFLPVIASMLIYAALYVKDNEFADTTVKQSVNDSTSNFTGKAGDLLTAKY